MWAKHLTLTNFRGFERLELDLDRPVTVLVGVNGSGKTSVLRAIAAAVETLRNRSAGPIASLDRRDLRVGSPEGEVHCRVSVRNFESRVDLHHDTRSPHWGGGSATLPNTSIISLGMLPVHDFFAFLAGTERHLLTAWVPTNATAQEDSLSVLATVPGYGRFLAWFKEREDAENARRVARADLTLEDPQLRAVRAAVAALMPGFDKLRIDRDQPAPAMVVTKAGVELRLDQLSDGERNLIALAGDLARRMVTADPTNESPLDAVGVILIDEVEQHLHPAWQRQVIPALQRAFAKAQLIVTTHSPQVLSSVPASAVVVLDGFSAHGITGATKGRDTNAILREVFGVPDRPQPQLDELRAIRALIDDDTLDAARARLDALAATLSEQDDDVVALRMRMHVAEATA